MANRLRESTSPYLLQHADNPVDWWPWCPEAFEAARERDVPVLLSVGYASCHWCHVMAHESFEDPAVAAVMNEHFVNIKVDREERPDVDAVYMEVATAMTGHGGWPMTVFLTPAARPFYAGTYFPPRPRGDMPSFGRVLAAVHSAWTDRRAELVASGEDIASQLALLNTPRAAQPFGRDVLDAGAANLAQLFDRRHGGFGGAPKFPPAAVAELLLRRHARTQDAAALEMVALTCDRMARGGIYDQLAGGFARYSVDATWTVPHFEKMLYDNAQLLSVYLHLWRATGAPLAERVARETAGFLLRDLRTDEGGFASALDADTPADPGEPAEPKPGAGTGTGPHGAEGATYVWTPAQLAEVLGPDDAAFAATALGVSAAGNFERGASVLTRAFDPATPEAAARLESARARLLAARRRRPQPARDDKVVAAWNGLAIGALAEAGALLGEPSFVDAAAGAARLLRDVHLSDGRLTRTSRAGRPGTNPGVLEDYADVAQGLLTLHQVTGEQEWLDLAGELLATVEARFAAGDGGYHDTADDAEELLRRPRDTGDAPTPSGQAAFAGAALTYAAITGSARHRDLAEATLATLARPFPLAPTFGGHAAAVAEALLAGPAEVAVVDRPDLEHLARMTTSPGAVVVTAGPLTDGRGAPGVYVCRNFVCERPALSAEAVRSALAVRASA